MSLWESRLLPGAGGGSPARRGAWGERGKSPLHPLHPRTPLCAGTRNLSLELGCTPSAACRMGHRREPSPACGRGDVRACCGAPSSLRASGIASAPAARCISGNGRKGGTLPGGSGGGKLADRRAVFLSFVGSCRNAFHLWRTGEVAPVSRRVKGRSLMLRGGLCVLLFSGGILCCFSRAISLKCFAFQTIRPVVPRKKRGFSAHFGPGGAVPRLGFCFFKGNALKTKKPP